MTSSSLPSPTSSLPEFPASPFDENSSGSRVCFFFQGIYGENFHAMEDSRRFLLLEFLSLFLAEIATPIFGYKLRTAWVNVICRMEPKIDDDLEDDLHEPFRVPPQDLRQFAIWLLQSVTYAISYVPYAE